MRKILEDLYWGKIDPSVKQINPKRPDNRYRLLQERRATEEDRLLNLLDPTQTQQFKTYLDIHDEIWTIINLDTFVEGFRLGAALMLAVQTDGDGFFSDLS